ncbi:MAG: polyprenyl diphosphate synthase [Cyanobacteria bacterium]|nr:polyprenyl diphosphate synthase [Cyanobacteriota bacterium]
MEVLPKHIAIIMDGNGRWAQSKGKPRLYGHQAGRKNVKKVVMLCIEFKISYLSLFVFSTENFKRPKPEVAGLFLLLEKAIDEELPELKKEGVKIIVSGEIQMLPVSSQEALAKLVQETSSNKKLTLNLCINYGGQQEIISAINKILKEVKQKKITSFDKNSLSKYLYHNIPFPDLLIRTGGEFRISNFFLWQCAYSELYFTKTFWPNFNRMHFVKALNNFAKRQRRFGKVFNN